MGRKNRIVINACRLIGIIHISIAIGITLGLICNGFAYILVACFFSTGGICCLRK